MSDNSDPSRTTFLWKWTKGHARVDDFSDPLTGDTNYALCVYDDGVLRMSPAISAGGTCGNRPCWSRQGDSSLKYRNASGNADGITLARMKPGSSNGKIMVKGKGVALPFPVGDTANVTVQLIKNPGSGLECWESVFPNPARQNTASSFLARIPPAAPLGPLGGDRPVSVHVPPSYTPGVPMPLVVMLHGYSASGALEEFYLGFTATSDSRGFLYVYPDGTVDSHDKRFWNATDACCNFDDSPVDDSAYVSGIIEGVAARYSVARDFVFVIGHSNGGFMAYRMACEHAGKIAAIVSLAGAMWNDTARCTPSSQVSVLEIHGTADAVISYTGGSISGNAYPGAQTSVDDWVALNECNPTPDVSAPPKDLDSSIAGNETTVKRYTGCDGGTGVELWTMNGSGHIPSVTAEFRNSVIDFLFAHARP